MIWLLDRNVVTDFPNAQLAAIAREYGLTIATRNLRHFPFCRIENPFELRDPAIEPAE